MRWKVSAEAGQRLDVAIVAKFLSISRAFAGHLIDEGKVMVNGQPSKAGYKLRSDDAVEVDYDGSELPMIPNIDLPIIYEDDDCVVINKPVGMLTHSKGAFNPEATVATWLRSRVNRLSGERAGIVHRLDRMTSGVMICAKTPQALSWLQKQFSQRKVKKTYVAIVASVVEPVEAVIDMPIERNPKAPATFRVNANGKSAVTHYKVIKQSTHFSLLELQPETGRTHQLRVHLKHLGRPIIGDTLYGGSLNSSGSKDQTVSRLYLHAKSLEITVPNRERKVFSAPVPKAFDRLLEQDA